MGADLAPAWQPTGPYGGEAEFIAASQAEPGLLVAGTRGALIFQSSDAGLSWRHVHFPRQLSAEMHALQLDPKQKGTWFVGVEDQVPSQSGLYKTTDSGQTWTQLPGLRGMAVWSVALWPADARVMAAGTADGVYLSTDAGGTWKRISPEDDKELRPVVSLAFHPYERQTLYAGTTHLPWRTNDGGLTWTSIHDGMLDDSDVFSITPDPGHPDLVLASACSGVYRSYDAGKLWSRLPTPPGAFRVYLVARDPRNSQIVFAATTNGLLRSVNGGAAWSKVSSAVVKSITFDPSDTKRVYAASTNAGILRSSDEGLTFQDSNQGFSDHNLTALVGAGGVLYTSAIYEGAGSGVFRSDDQGHTWIPVAAHGGDNLRFVRATPGRPNLLFAATLRSLLKSSDGGRTWLPIPSPGGRAVRALDMLPAANQPHPPAAEIFAATDAGLFRTANEGLLWKPVPLAGQADPAAGQSSLQWIQSSGASALAAGSDRAAWLSTDAGKTWTACARPLDVAQWYGLASDSKAEGVALAATSHGLFRSTDGCRSWSPASTGASGTVSLVIAHPSRPETFVAAQGGRLLVSGDGGLVWRQLASRGSEVSYPSALVILPSSPEDVFTLLPRRGVYRIGPLALAGAP
ncbi:MAG TPA: hypothetical protein VKV17_12990 [Bryobacteraceae bacterium]|nr:hypothetical protein [Bryobacteraceae bacterium]